MALVDEIEKTPRRCNENVDAARKRLDLRALAEAPDDHRIAKVKVTPVSLEAVVDLNRQFARRRQDQGPWRARAPLFVSGAKPLHERQREGGGLARAGLGEAQQIPPSQQQRNGLYLDGRRLGITLGCERAAKRLADAEFDKRRIVH